MHAQSPPRLAPDEIHVCQAHLILDASSQALLHSHLSDDENRRAARFRFDRDRDRFIAARGTLRTLLARYLRRRPRDLQFLPGREGKPALAPEPAGDTLNFNVSHSHDVSVFAFGWNRTIGVDVERVRPDVEYEDIARHHFSAGEIQSLARLPREMRVEAFFRCWTRKEAYIKACGGGLQIPLDGFDVSAPDDRARLPGGGRSSWRISSFMAGNEYPAALVYDGRPVDLRFFMLGRDALQGLQQQIDQMRQ